MDDYDQAVEQLAEKERRQQIRSAITKREALPFYTPEVSDAYIAKQYAAKTSAHGVFGDFLDTSVSEPELGLLLAHLGSGGNVSGHTLFIKWRDYVCTEMAFDAAKLLATGEAA
jgi:hypothetical protein